MKKLRLDFDNRIVSIVSDQKTVIAYMDDDLKKKDFKTYFPDKKMLDGIDHVTFDFENSQICLKEPVHQSKPTDHGEVYKCVQRVPVPSINAERKNILRTVGWKEPEVKK